MGIPSPPQGLFAVMLPKAHSISHSRMSGFRWVITLSWLSGLWWYFLHSSSVYSCCLSLISSASVRSLPFLSFIVLDLIVRVPDDLWMEFCDIIQETWIKTIPKKKKCKKAKWLSEEALQIAVKRREVESKGEKETYTHLNAKFQKNSKER